MLAYITPAYAESTITEAVLVDLDQRTAEASNRVSDYLAQAAIITYTEIDPLVLQVARLNKDGDKLNAVRTIKTHLDLIRKNIDNKAVFTFIRILLENNDKAAAEQLYQHIVTEGDKSLASNASYLFAKYYQARNDWTQVINVLDGIFIDLPANDANYAYLIYGTALQHLKQHREAVNYYNKISNDSQYYAYGQLNTAIAYIRQDWWTDAHIIIDKVLHDQAVIKSDEFINRLYLVLGYSLLQKDYYRDSRAAFRNISQDSEYANRALLGISLTAASQTDYIGSLNLLAILKNKTELDLTVDESYLIIPYVYSNLKQYLTASASYTEALAYYQKRIEALEKIAASNSEYSLDEMTSKDGVFLINNNLIDLTEKYPESFFTNLKVLKSLRSATINDSLKNNILQLNSAAQKTLNTMLQEALEERKSQLNSYLNQARYGLARMYDSNQTSGQ